MLKLLHIFVITIYLSIAAFSANADVISGKIEFLKKPPKAGVIYEVKSSYKTISPRLNQTNKQFSEMIVVGSMKSSLHLKNEHSLDHNIFANDIKQDVKFDVGLMSPASDTDINLDWKENTLVRVGCKIHPKMRSYIANIPSDNFVSFEFSKKQKNAPFELGNVLAGSDTFFLLLAGYDSLEIKIKKGETKSVDLVRKGKKKGIIELTRS